MPEQQVDRNATASPSGGMKIITTENKDNRVIYECNFTVDCDIVKEFLDYLRNHMKEIVRLEEGTLFDRATLCVAEEEGLHHPDKYRLCARYRAKSRFRLQEYFDKAGERLRKDMQEQWEGKFEVQRRILALDSIIEGSPDAALMFSDEAAGGGGGNGSVVAGQ